MNNNYGILSLGHLAQFFCTKKGSSSFFSTRKEVLPILSILSEKLATEQCVNPSWRSALETFFTEVEWNWPNFLRYIKLFYQSGRIKDREFGALIENQVWEILVELESSKDTGNNEFFYTSVDGVSLDLNVYRTLFEFFNRMADEEMFPLRVSTYRTKWFVNKIMGVIVVFSSEKLLRKKDSLFYQEFLNVVSSKIAEQDKANMGVSLERIRNQLVMDVIEEGVILAAHSYDYQGSISSPSEYWVQLFSDKITFTLVDKTSEYYISSKLTIMDTSNVGNVKKKSELVKEYDFSLRLVEPDLHYKIILKFNKSEEVARWHSQLHKAKINFESQTTQVECELSRLDEIYSTPSLPGTSKIDKAASFNCGRRDKETLFGDKLKKIQELRRKSWLQLTHGSSRSWSPETLTSLNEESSQSEKFIHKPPLTPDEPGEKGQKGCICGLCQGEVIRDCNGKPLPPPKPPRRSLKPQRAYHMHNL